MKANRKFVTNDDDAVSPVIAVILMVAITVVLAATVYVWVSGFGGSGSDPAKTISLSSAGAIKDCSSADCKTYTVAGASPGLKYEDIKIVLNGNALTFEGKCNPSSTPTAVTQYTACAGTTTRATTDLISAGDKITLKAATGGLSGKELQILDPNSNSVMLTLTVS